jgi:hypothetical protein
MKSTGRSQSNHRLNIRHRGAGLALARIPDKPAEVADELVAAVGLADDVLGFVGDGLGGVRSC